MYDSLIKKIALFAIIFGMIFIVTACSDSNPFSGGGGSPHNKDVQITIKPEGDVSSVNTDSVINESSFRVLPSGDVELRLDSNSVAVDNGEIKVEGTLMNIRGDVSLRISHSDYGTSNSRSITYNSSEPISFVIDPTVDEGDEGDEGDEVDDGDGENGDSDDGSDDGEDPQEIEGDIVTDVSVERKFQGVPSDIRLYSIDFDDYDQISMADKVYVYVNHSGVSYIEDIDDLIEGNSSINVDSEPDSDENPEIDIALLDNQNKQFARAEAVKVSESLEEIGFLTDVDEIEITSAIFSQSVSAQSVNYLASKTLDLDDVGDQFTEKWHDFKLAHDLEYQLPGSIYIINHIAIGWDFNFDDADMEDSFLDVFDQEHQMSGGRIEDMGLYYRLGRGADIQDARTGTVIDNDEEIRAGITDLYVELDNGQGNPPYPRASAPVSFEYLSHYNDEADEQVHVYRVTVHPYDEGIAGLPEARSFTIGSPENDARDFGDPLEITSSTQLNELDIYILGLDADDLEGDGTLEKPFKISTPEQLNEVLRYDVTKPNIYYKLVADINMEDFDDWYPVGSESRPFQGNLDGQNYEITNMSIDTNGRAGIFGKLGENAEIKNIKLNSFDVSGRRYVGILAARNSGHIENIEILPDEESSVFGDDQYVGGLVGHNFGNGTIKDSFVRGDVSSDGEYVGGLAGANTNATIDNNESEATVTGVEAVGGLVGWNNSNGIKNSTASGDVTGETRVGGLVGLNDGTIVESRYDDGTVDGEGYFIGGLVGTNRNPDGNIEYSTVQGATVNGYNSVGGLAGVNRGRIVRNDVINTNVNGENNNIGGLVGDNREDGLVSNNEFQGNVSGRYNVGGIAGRNTATGEFGIVKNDVYYENDITGIDEETTDEWIGNDRGDSSGNGGIGYIVVEFIEPRERISAGDTLNFDVKVENIGDRPAVQTIELMSEDTGEVLKYFEIDEDNPLDGDESRERSLSHDIPDLIEHSERVFIVRSDNDSDRTTVEITDSYESVNYLSNIEISGEGEPSWEPNFNSDTEEYTVTVDHENEEVDISAELQGEYSSMQIIIADDGEELNNEEFERFTEEDTKEVGLGDGGDTTEVEIKVTAEDDSTKIYEIGIKRAVDPDEPSIEDSDFDDLSGEKAVFSGSTFDLKFNLTFGQHDVIDNTNRITIDSDAFANGPLELEFNAENIDGNGKIEITIENVDISDVINTHNVEITSVKFDQDNVADIESSHRLGEIEVKEKEYSIRGEIETQDISFNEGTFKITINLNDGDKGSYEIELDKNNESDSFEFKSSVDSSDKYEITVDMHSDSDFEAGVYELSHDGNGAKSFDNFSIEVKENDFYEDSEYTDGVADIGTITIQ